MASCGAEQYSSFNEDKGISLYTSFVCDALTSHFLIRKGKKSLDTINVFFDVEEYNPYKIARIYEETDNNIIYSVEPVHHAGVKRLSVKVILRFQSSMEQIAEIATEIKNKAIYQYPQRSCMIGRIYIQNFLAQYMIFHFFTIKKI